MMQEMKYSGLSSIGRTFAFQEGFTNDHEY